MPDCVGVPESVPSGESVSPGGKPGARLVEQRMRETAASILSLRNQQRLLAAMLSRIASGKPLPVVNVKLWIEMLEAAGIASGRAGMPGGSHLHER